MMERMFPLAEGFFCGTVDSERSLQAQALAEQLQQQGQRAFACDDLLRGLTTAVRFAEQQHCRVVCFGSLYFIGEVKRELQDNPSLIG